MSHTPLRAGSKRLIDEDKAVALFGYFGDVPVNAALPIIKEKRIALVSVVAYGRRSLCPTRRVP